MKFVIPVPNSNFNFYNSKGVQLITRLHLGLNHLRTHKFKQSFQDSLNQSCCYLNSEIESSSHHILHLSLYLNERTAFWDNVTCFYSNIFNQINLKITQVLLFGEPSLMWHHSDETNNSILNLKIIKLSLSDKIILDKILFTFICYFGSFGKFNTKNI